MSAAPETIEAPLDRDQLATRWRALCADPTFEDLAAKIELTEWGEILMSPVGKTHGLLAARIVKVLDDALGGRTMVEVGVATDLGVRVPDVAWCSSAFLAAHPEEAPLGGAPELCVEIASPSDARPKLREKAAAYVGAGATEAWLVFPRSRQIEIYGAEGRRQATSFAIDLRQLFS
ncbi:MAG: Uma2 family endonuclease [Burkholderiales bacterium]